MYAVLLALGIVLRIAALPLADTYIDVYKGWSYVAATRGEARLYDWAAAPHDHTRRRIDGFNAQGDYPPLALYELGLAGRLYHRASGGRFPQTAALTAAVKAPALVAEAGLAVLLFLVVRRAAGVKAARWASLLFWLNPAMILATSVLTCVDALFVLPAIGALAAGVAGRPALAGSLIAAAVLTKPQAIFIVPAVAIATWNATLASRTARIRSALAGAAVTSLVIVTPIVAAGATLNMIRAVGSNTLGPDMLSNACNLWWIVGHVLRLMQEPGIDFGSAVRLQAEIVPVSAFASFDLIFVRVVVRTIGSALPLAAIAWGIWTARRSRNLWLVSATAAFCVHAYVVLATQVHENHLFAAVPLLGLAAAGRQAFVPLLGAVSTILALNLNLLYGLGENDLRYAIPRTPIDLTLIVAAANCAALAWHAAVLRRECVLTGPGTSRAPSPILLEPSAASS